MFNIGVNLLKILTFRFSSEVNFTDCSLLLKKISEKRRNEGDLTTILWIKDLRTIVYSFLSGRPVNPGYISTSKDGLPRALGPLKTYQRSGDPSKIRYVLTVLQLSRLIEAWKSPSLSSITQGGPDLDLHDLEEACPAVMLDMGIKPRKYPSWEAPHFSVKSGPNSSPAMVSACRELYSLIHDPQYSKLWKSIQVLGGGFFSEYAHSPSFDGECPQTELRKLSLVKDVDGKNRVIAIGDYWSQTVLKPLHLQSLKMLRSQEETDVTYGQSIGPFGSLTHNYHSFDLTSATDRQPIKVNQILMRYLYGQDVTDAWKTIMVESSFLDFTRQSYVKYEVGQPMGLYSSWTLLALTHHFQVRYSALKIGILKFRDYRLQGDDIVIRHNAVAESYLKVMTDLGVEISPSKTQVSSDTFEFAKRFFYKGHEVTGLPLTSQCRKGITPSDVLGFLQISGNRGYSLDTTYAFDLIKLIVGFVFNIGGSKRFKAPRGLIVEILASWYLMTGSEFLYKELALALGIYKCVGNHHTLLRELLTLLLEDIYREAPAQLDHSSKLLADYLGGAGKDAVKDSTQSVDYGNRASPLQSAVDSAYERILYGGTDIWVINPRFELELQTRDEMIHTVYSSVKNLDIAGQNPVLARTTRSYNRSLMSVSNATRRSVKLYVDSLSEMRGRE